MQFKDETKWPRLAQSPFEMDTKEDGDDANANEVKDNVMAAGPENVKASVLFQTKFTNDTGHDQEYTMHTSKTTRSSCETVIENSYTKGYDMCVTLKTPCEIFEMNAGYHREMSLTNCQGETLEEELTWSVDSQIKVKAGYIATAKLIVNEKNYKGDFYVISTLCGPVHVTFNNLKDNNSLIRSGEVQIGTVVREFLKLKADVGERYDENYIRVEGRDVIITTKGSCKFRCGIKQEVIVKQVRMPSFMRTDSSALPE